MVPSATAVGLQMQFGEGATPTWETASYAYALDDFSNGAYYNYSPSTTAINLTYPANVNGFAGTAGQNVNLTAWIRSVGSNSLFKYVSFASDYYYSTSWYENSDHGGGTYYGDTNPV